MREEIFRSTSDGNTYQSAVMKSSDCTALSAITYVSRVSTSPHNDKNLAKTRLFISPLVTHDTHCPDWQEHRESLSDLVVQPRIANFIYVDLICQLQDLDLFAGDGTEDADGEPGPGEWVALDEGGGDGEEAAQSAHLICKRSDK